MLFFIYTYIYVDIYINTMICTNAKAIVNEVPLYDGGVMVVLVVAGSDVSVFHHLLCHKSHCGSMFENSIIFPAALK